MQLEYVSHDGTKTWNPQTDGFYFLQVMEKITNADGSYFNQGTLFYSQRSEDCMECFALREARFEGCCSASEGTLLHSMLSRLTFWLIAGLEMKKALIVVDVQNDFVEGGALAVAGGLALVPKIRRLVAANSFSKLVYTQDYHPLHTAHFDKWPVHCVAGSTGADLVAGLPMPDGTVIVRKGQSTVDDGYSGFDGTNLAELLTSDGIDTLYVCGIATDYCVKATVLDALRLGFKVFLVMYAIAGVDKEASKDAVTTMLSAGAVAF